MSTQNDRFGEGVIVGIIFGSALGALVASVVNNRGIKTERATKAIAPASTEEVLGEAKRSLEEKISQLNEAIESAREKMAAARPTEE